MTAIALNWVDPGAVEFTETDDEPDGVHVFATWHQAKQAALESAIDNREQWAACARRLRTIPKREALAP